MRRLLGLCVTWVMTMSLVLATGDVATGVADAAETAAIFDDLTDEELLLSRLESAKDDVLTALSDRENSAIEQFSQAYESFAVNNDYNNVLCLQIVSLDASTVEITDASNDLTSAILQDYAALVRDITLDETEYAEGLMSDAAYAIALSTNQSDVDGFLRARTLSVENFLTSQLSELDELRANMDSYIASNGDDLVLLTARRAALAAVMDLYYDVDALQRSFVEALDLGDTEALDRVWDSIARSFDGFVAETNDALVARYPHFAVEFASYLDGEYKLVKGSALLALQEVFAPMTNYTSSEQFALASSYKDTLAALYYADGDLTQQQCLSISDVRQGDLVEDMENTLLDLKADLEAGHDFYSLGSGGAVADGAFADGLQGAMDSILADAKELYEKRTTVYVATLQEADATDRSVLKDLVQTIVDKRDEPYGWETSVMAKAKALSASAISLKMSYDAAMIANMLGAPMYLYAYDHHERVTVTQTTYITTLFLDLISYDGDVEELIRPVSTLQSKYTFSSVMAKLLLMQEAAPDKAAFEKRLNDAIARGKKMLIDPRVPLKNKTTVDVLVRAMMNVVGRN